ncbi:MAG: hypothetical protein ACLR0U_24535 [Enterocloster clostridioformis]
MAVYILDNSEELGEKAADLIAKKLNRSHRKKGTRQESFYLQGHHSLRQLSIWLRRTLTGEKGYHVSFG